MDSSSHTNKYIFFIIYTGNGNRQQNYADVVYSVYKLSWVLQSYFLRLLQHNILASEILFGEVARQERCRFLLFA